MRSTLLCYNSIKVVLQKAPNKIVNYDEGKFILNSYHTL